MYDPPKNKTSSLTSFSSEEQEELMCYDSKQDILAFIIHILAYLYILNTNDIQISHTHPTFKYILYLSYATNI